MILIPDSRLSHTVQRIWHDLGPAQCPGRVLLIRVLLDQTPFLPRLRSAGGRIVRPVRRYYESVRLPLPVHRWIMVLDLPNASPHLLGRGRTRDLPVLAHRVSARAGGLRPRRVTLTLALTRPCVLPSVRNNDVGTLGAPVFAAQYSARVCRWLISKSDSHWSAGQDWMIRGPRQAN